VLLLECFPASLALLSLVVAVLLVVADRRVPPGFALLFCSALLLAGCGGGYSTPSTPTPASPPFSATEIRVGTGTEAAAGRTVTVNYTGWLYSPTQPDQKGQQFDTSVGGTPFTFAAGTGRVIQGFDRGVIGMKVGGMRRLVIPPELAYGNQQVGTIPPNSTLVFDIELLNVQ
jgi:FKBP-type peptidyl-prolyl cis-trans isomerase FkpA